MMPWKLLIDIFVAFIECYIVYECLKSYSACEKTNYIVIIIAVILQLLFAVIASLFIKIPCLRTVVNIVFYFIMSFGFKINRRKSLGFITIFSLIYSLIEILILLIISSINNINITDFLQTSIEAYTIGVILCVCTVYAIFTLLLCKRKQTDVDTSKKFLILQTTIPVIIIAILFIEACFIIKSNNEFFRIFALASPILLMISNVILYKILDKFAIKENINSQKEKRIFELEQERILYDKNTQFAITCNKNIHELKNKIFAINEYLKEDSPKAGQLVGELCNQLYANQVIQFSGIPALDALLNVRFNDALDKGIIVKKHIFCGGDINVDVIDLCVVVGNLLTNAIESAVECNDKSIELNIINKIQYLSITLKNSTINSVVVVGASTKPDKFAHGYGLQNIQEVVDKYDGSCLYSVKDGKFYATIILKNC